MQSFLVACLLGLTSAAPSAIESATCLLDSGEAISDVLDASLFVWAAVKRCEKPDDGVKCEVDVSSAVKSTVSMLNVILKSIDKCDNLHIVYKECSMQAGQLTEHAAALAAAAGGVYQKCKDIKNFGKENPNLPPELVSPVMCTIDLKNSGKGFVRLVRELMGIHDSCTGDTKKCASKALNVAGALAAMGQFVSGSIGQCKRTNLLNPNAAKGGIDTRGELCTQEVTALIEYTTKISQDSLVMTEACKRAAGTEMKEENDLGGSIEALEDKAKSDAILGLDQSLPEGEVPPIHSARLYTQHQGKTDDSSAPALVLVLAAFLPLTAIVSFVGGRFTAARRYASIQEPEVDGQEQATAVSPP